MDQYLPPDKIMILILSFLAFLTIIIVAIQWRRVREAENNVKLLEKEIELKKIALVEKDIEAKKLMESAITLPKDQQEKLAKIRKDTSKLMKQIRYLQNEIEVRLSRLEAQTEFKKLQEMLKKIKNKESELERRLKKF
ncbi:conserved hypothetical protein [Methanothermus fervidus DSM 2088]|uniref:Uncharacterized protein n=1 Tax=Methanothermus fervidus (strain ATCC 43054 / DSM 2088 / JCM 10308 / V24 S) TaxID=523846 RepID=E3GYG6_METFV|nr:hypothetical protein [Methanothermus fervidus]ADP77348.1 conserved hypothetical protein [Methanothermus fervidus DSM 2088]